LRPCSEPPRTRTAPRAFLSGPLAPGRVDGRQELSFWPFSLGRGPRRCRTPSRPWRVKNPGLRAAMARCPAVGAHPAMGRNCPDFRGVGLAKIRPPVPAAVADRAGAGRIVTEASAARAGFGDYRANVPTLLNGGGLRLRDLAVESFHVPPWASRKAIILADPAINRRGILNARWYIQKKKKTLGIVFGGGRILPRQHRRGIIVVPHHPSGDPRPLGGRIGRAG